MSWERSELFDPAKYPGEFHNAIDDPGNAGIVKELTAIAERNYRSKNRFARAVHFLKFFANS